MQQNKLHGENGFEQFYAERFDSRWPDIRQALLKPSAPIAWQLPGAAQYYLDPASIMAAAALPPGGKRLLDMCAAPGGKSLVLASMMDEDADLVCNERSASRYHRLCRTIDDCLPPEIRQRIKTTCSDGATMCRRVLSHAKDGSPIIAPLFDRILLDAPCSSERHVFTDSKYLALWSPARIKSLAMAEWALVSSAWRMLEPGGYLLYSTCALCTEENDGIIGRLLHKFTDAKAVKGTTLNDEGCFAVARRKDLPRTCSVEEGSTAINDGVAPDYHVPIAECTQFGRAVLPDTARGAGPIYFALIHKQ